MHPQKKANAHVLEVLGHVAKKMRSDRLGSKFPKPAPTEEPVAPGEPDGDEAVDPDAKAAQLAKMRSIYGHLKPKE
jgi:hypothetical protein